MKNEWDDRAAKKIVAHYKRKGIAKDLALRVYTTRLLGSVSKLVLHGGGNTSLKTSMTDLVGDKWDVLCVKGSGWDMGNIEPAGLPSVKLAPLLRVRHLKTLSDEKMVKLQRANLIDPASPNPSVETLLHAFLPQKYVDHTHSTAILSIINQPNSADLCRDIFGFKLGFVPYVAPGFDLAKLAVEIYETNTNVEGLILDKHGIFTFGETAKISYFRMIKYVTAAERRIQKGRKSVFKKENLPKKIASRAVIAPILRGAIAEHLGDGSYKHFVLEHRNARKIMTFVNGEGVSDYATRGVSTPDLVIRTKKKPMITLPPSESDLKNFAISTFKRAKDYASEYSSYFDRCNALDKVKRIMLDKVPRIIIVPGLGLFGVGRNQAEAIIVADLAEIWIEAIIDAERIGRFTPLSEEELFKLEYWSLEQAKINSTIYKPLSGHVVVLTGGAGTIGSAIAKVFAREGAHVAVLDLDCKKANKVAKEAGNGAISMVCDVTKPSQIAAVFSKVCDIFGGVDILISNAGSASQGAMGELDDGVLRRSFELNFFAHQTAAKAAVNIMLAQGIGGVLLFNASKQAVNPGVNFGSYGIPKAATLFLSRQYALEYGKFGIRSNAVNADRIQSGLLTQKMIAERSKARGITSDAYLSGNLLGREVTPTHVAEAFLWQALSTRTTANVTTVDGGNIAAAMR